MYVEQKHKPGQEQISQDNWKFIIFGEILNFWWHNANILLIGPWIIHLLKNSSVTVLIACNNNNILLGGK